MSTALASLDALAAEANENHKLAESTAGRAIEFARKSGEALIAAKAQLNTHGAWLPWVAANFEATQRTANNYMRLAANWKSISNLKPAGVVEALELLRPDKPEAEPEEPEEEIPAPFAQAIADVEEGRVSDAEELPEEPAARSVPVEVVDDEEEGEPQLEEEDGEPEPPECEPEKGVGLVYARTALDALNKIPKRDPSRKAAVALISQWLDANR